jgi:hypothetical protein
VRHTCTLYRYNHAVLGLEISANNIVDSRLLTAQSLFGIQAYLLKQSAEQSASQLVSSPVHLNSGELEQCHNYKHMPAMQSQQNYSNLVMHKMSPYNYVIMRPRPVS